MVAAAVAAEKGVGGGVVANRRLATNGERMGHAERNVSLINVPGKDGDVDPAAVLVNELAPIPERVDEQRRRVVVAGVIEPEEGETTGAVAVASAGPSVLVSDSVDVVPVGLSPGAKDDVTTTATEDGTRSTPGASTENFEEGGQKPPPGAETSGVVSGEEAGSAGVVSMATAVPGAAWRAVWGSARAMGATVGVSPRGEQKMAPRPRGKSSHAVLIL